MITPTKNHKTLFRQINWSGFLWTIWILWTVNSLFSTFSAVFYRAARGDEILWMHIFWYNYISALVWMIFTPLILWNVFRIPIEQNKWLKTICSHLLFALIISSAQRFIYLSIDYYFQNYFGLWALEMTYSDYLSSMYVSRVFNGLLTYFVIAALLYGYFFYLKNLENKAIQTQLLSNLNKSRIQNLKYQMQPHFLFNSMQVITNLMYKNVELADEAITQLSDLLRLSIKQLDVDKILLKEEVNGIEKYLNFQKLRFGENIISSIDCDPALYNYKIPVMLLQPFVENAIQYGFEKTGQPTKIEIIIRLEDQHLCCQISDNGSGFNKEDLNKSEGIGIKNVLSRLESLYADQFEFQIKQTESGVSIIIYIPLSK